MQHYTHTSICLPFSDMPLARVGTVVRALAIWDVDFRAYSCALPPLFRACDLGAIGFHPRDSSVTARVCPARKQGVICGLQSEIFLSDTCLCTLHNQSC